MDCEYIFELHTEHSGRKHAGSQVGCDGALHPLSC